MKLLENPLGHDIKASYHMKDNKIEKTSNRIENAFQKIMPKSRKLSFKTIRGVLKRICRRDLI